MVDSSDFERIWAANRADPTPISDADYEAGWRFLGAAKVKTGHHDFVFNLIDQKLKYLFDNSGPGGATPSVVAIITGTSYNVGTSDNCHYCSFSNMSAKTVNVRAQATHALPDDFEVNIRNAAVSNLTIVPAVGVTITAPYAGSMVVPPNGTVTLKRVSSDTFHLMGVTLP